MIKSLSLISYVRLKNVIYFLSSLLSVAQNDLIISYDFYTKYRMTNLRMISLSFPWEITSKCEFCMIHFSTFLHTFFILLKKHMFSIRVSSSAKIFHLFSMYHSQTYFFCSSFFASQNGKREKYSIHKISVQWTFNLIMAHYRVASNYEEELCTLAKCCGNIAEIKSVSGQNFERGLSLKFWKVIEKDEEIIFGA